MDKKIKICIIGCGAMAQSGHGPALRKYARENNDTELTACCDIDINQAEKFKKEFGFEKAYSDYKEMLEKENPDGVSIIVPVNLTAEIASQVLLMGYPIITEKPPGLSAKELNLIKNASEKSDKLVLTAFNRRYSPAIFRAKEIISSEFKNVSNIYYTMIRARRLYDDFSTTATHAIDAVRHLAGSDYKKVEITYRPVCGFEEYGPDMFITGTMKSGTEIRIDLSVSAGLLAEKFIVNGTDKTIMAEIPVISDFSGKMEYYSVGISKEHNIEPKLIEANVLANDIPFFEGQGFYRENAHFVNMIKQNNSAKNSDISEAMQTVVISEAIRNRKNVVEFH